MSINGIMLQIFEWHMPAGILWKRLAEKAGQLAEDGFTSLWVPPPYKGHRGVEDEGYGVYDLYDLGEFPQKGTIPTKYGSRDEFLAAVKAAQASGLEVYADIVLDHMMGADGLEVVEAEEFNPDNRLEKQSDLKQIEANTHFYFPGRNKKYSDFEWHWYHFTGIDCDQREQEEGVFKFRGKYWERQVDKENGNYDYLMGASLDLNHPEVQAELKKWGLWFIKTTGIDGFRLDAVKHMKFTFYNAWLHEMRTAYNREFFTVGEYWSKELAALTNYLDTTDEALSLFDVPLHFKFCQAAQDGQAFDLRTIFENTLTAENPVKSVTFVDNHDTQPGQSLESWVDDWFKPLAYALILLRAEGYPCVFYGDYFGIEESGIPAKRDMLRPLLKARTKYAYGQQNDYFQNEHLIGWVRTGDEENPGSGLAAVLSTGEAASLEMGVGRPGAEYYDLTGNVQERVKIDDQGNGQFRVNGGSVSVWVEADS